MQADVSISTRFHFLGIPGRVFFNFDTGKIVKVCCWWTGGFVMGKVVKVCYWWMVGFEPTTPKPMVVPTTPFVKDLEGTSLFDRLQKINILFTQTK